MEILEFLKTSYGNGSGEGDGSGDGSGSGTGKGYGFGYGSGDGPGRGSGYGYGDGEGNGNGYGFGYGSGEGDGNGKGYGDGDGVKIKSINKMSVYDIDNVNTVITKIKNNIAKGFIVNRDLTLMPCFIVKRNNLFAHGETLREAIQSLESKLFDDMPTEERIEMFLEEFEIGKKYQAKLFFDWHFKLTGSCEMGRLSFIKNNGIDLENDYYTVVEFIELVENDYGSEVIKELKNKIEEE